MTGFLGFIVRVNDKIFLNYDIERLKVTIKVAEDQLQNMQNRLSQLESRKFKDGLLRK